MYVCGVYIAREIMAAAGARTQGTSAKLALSRCGANAQEHRRFRAVAVEGEAVALHGLLHD
jgi:hypothetical protein